MQISCFATAHLAPPPRTRAPRAWQGLLVTLLMLLCLASAAARPLSGYQHRAFTPADGAPDNIMTISQDRDGMMWLGALGGVYTFDGQRFLKHPVGFRESPRRPFYLRGDPAGGVWISWMRGGLTLIRDGKTQHFDATDGLPPGTLWNFAFDRDGSLWVPGLNGVAHFDGRRWHRLGPEDGFDAVSAYSVHIDAEGTVGIFTDKGVYLKPRGATRFGPRIDMERSRYPLMTGPNGELYLMADSGLRRIASLQRAAQFDYPWLYRETSGRGASYLADRDGGLWFSSAKALHRLERPGARQPLRGQVRADAETLTRADGLSGVMMLDLFEDDRGDVWAITEGGLDRFRPSDLASVPVGAQNPLMRTAVVTAGEDGGVWVYSTFPNLSWSRLDAKGRVAERYLDDFDFTAIRDGDGLLTVRGQRQLVSLRGGVQHPVGPLMPDFRIVTLDRDTTGTFWAAQSNGAVLRGDGKAWTPVSALPAGQVGVIHAAPDGAIWLGFMNNQLVKMQGQTMTVYGAAQGLSVGVVTSIVEDGQTLWVAGTGGLNVLSGRRFRTLSSTPGMFDALAKVMPDHRGGLWLTGLKGLMYLAPSQLRGCPLDCPAMLVPWLYDHADGMKARSETVGQGQLAQDGLNRLWIGAAFGLYRVDSVPGGRSEPVARAQIMGATVAGQRYPGSAALQLPPGAHDVQLDYTAPVPDTPERVRFRYRLAGYDTAWQNADGRRQAFYTGLTRGDYRFEVAAAHGTGVWSKPAVLVVHIAPAWFQTWWWRTLCAVVLLSALAFLHRLRVLIVTRRVRAQDQARLQERERIARDLHDTVLQTNFALLLQVRAVAAAASGHAIGQRLDAIVGTAQATLTEGRDKVAGLRARQTAAPGFGAALEQLAKELLADSAITLVCTSVGRPWPLREAVWDESLAIVAESVTNARRHAGASALRIAIAFGWRTCVIAISDDGHGIPREYAAGRTGHWGLAGMRERAALIDARLDIDSGTAGTTVRLRLRRHHAGNHA
jgi:signal transduction histidine kinase/ligand-binding sensor domain-containing protein